MKKVMLVALVAALFSVTTYAQDSTTSRREKAAHFAKAHREQAFEELNLTQDQKDKMAKLREDNLSKIKAVQNDASLSDDQKQQKVKDLRNEQRKGFESILTDEQKAKMKQAREQRMKNFKDRKQHADSTMRK